MEEISLEEAKIHLKNLLYDTYDFRKYSRETDRQAINKVLKELDNRIPREKIENKRKECENRKFSDFTIEPNFAVDKVLRELLNKE